MLSSSEVMLWRALLVSSCSFEATILAFCLVVSRLSGSIDASSLGSVVFEDVEDHQLGHGILAKLIERCSNATDWFEFKNGSSCYL